MELSTFKEFLKKKDIILFDYEYRIALYKINLIKNEQIGGGQEVKLLSNKTKMEINQIINYTLSFNFKLGYLNNLIYN